MREFGREVVKETGKQKEAQMKESERQRGSTEVEKNRGRDKESERLILWLCVPFLLIRCELFWLQLLFSAADVQFILFCTSLSNNE